MRDKARGAWKKLHNEQLCDPYSSPNIIRVINSRRMRWAGHIACMEKRRGADRILTGKPEGNSSRGRPRRKWKDIIKMYQQEIG
jgi:hypothetical protein